MNLKNLFNNRNKNFARLNEAGDYLGRRLRENLVIYDIDDSNNRVTYVTESSNLISCHYKETNNKLTLENFNIAGLDEIMSDDAVDTQVQGNIHQFVTGLVDDRYDKAESSFDAIVESFTMRAKIEESRKKLNKKIARFGDAYNITETKSFSKFEEISPMLEKFLKENMEDLRDNSKLIEGLRLSKVCEKELVRKELMESKESFSRMWARNGHISNLASNIYSTDAVIKSALQEAVLDIPYVALSNKVDLSTVMESVFHITNPGTISQKDIREFVGKIYEFKKPLKAEVITALNEKYGVNVQSLRFVPSFKGLAEVQSEIFSMLGEAAGDGVLADVLKEFSVCMSRKGGVQVLDISNMLSNIMKEANFTVVDIDENFEMKKLSDYLKNNLQDNQYYGDDDDLSNDPGEGSTAKKGSKSKTKKGAKDFETKDGKSNFGGNKGDIKSADRKEDDDSKLTADEKGDIDDNDNDLPNNKEKKGKKLSKKQKAMDGDGDGVIDAKDLKKLRKEGVAEAEREVAQDGQSEEKSEKDAEDVAAFNDMFNKVQDISKTMKLDLEPDEEEADSADPDPTPEEDEEVEATEETEPTQ